MPEEETSSALEGDPPGEAASATVDVQKSPRLTVLVLLVGLVLTVSSYATALDNPFGYDDVQVVRNNALLANPAHWRLFFQMEVDSGRRFRTFRPLPMLSLLLNHQLGGTNPRGYRLVNLTLHLLCGLLVFFLVRRLAADGRLVAPLRPTPGQASAAAAVAALLFWLHPINALMVLVAWKRTTLFATLFMLLAVWLFLRSPGIAAPTKKPHRKLFLGLGIVAAYLGALGSKETSVVLPPLLLLLELVVWQRGSSLREHRWRLWVHIPLWIGVLVSLTVLFPKEVAAGADVAPWTYLLIQAKVVWLYVGMVFAPTLIAPAYNISVPGSLLEAGPLAGAVTLAGLALASIVLWRRYTLLPLALCWALIALAPTSSLVPNQLHVDEARTYLAFVPLWALFGLGLVSVWRGRWRKTAALVVLGAVVTTMIFFSVDRAVTWRHELWIWRAALRKYPGAKRAQLGLCSEFAQRRDARAIGACREALRSQPNNTIAQWGLATSYLHQGRIPEARKVIAGGLRGRPDFYLLRLAGDIALKTKHYPEAERHYRAALRLNGWDLFAALSLATVWVELGQQPRALTFLRTLQRMHPGRPEPRLAWLELAVDTGQKGVEKQLDLAVRQIATTPRLLFHASAIYQKLGRRDRAIQILERVTRLEPSATLAWRALAKALLAQGERGRACAIWRRVGAGASVKRFADVVHACRAPGSN